MGFFTRFLAASLAMASVTFAVVVSFIAAGLDLFASEARRMIAAAPGLTLATTGHALDASLQQSLRFESRVPRRSAARNI
jgi:hypothetical protein